jgi:hypothetical protein
MGTKRKEVPREDGWRMNRITDVPMINSTERVKGTKNGLAILSLPCTNRRVAIRSRMDVAQGKIKAHWLEGLQGQQKNIKSLKE